MRVEAASRINAARDVEDALTRDHELRKAIMQRQHRNTFCVLRQTCTDVAKAEFWDIYRIEASRDWADGSSDALNR